MTDMSSAYQRFISDLSLPGCVIQAGAANSVDTQLTQENYQSFLAQNQSKDLFFLAGVAPDMNMKRAGDKDIKTKGHFFLDFDIRNFWLNAYGENLSDGEIIEMGVGIVASLKEHPLLSRWRYLIFSGNGIHFQFVSPPVYSPSPDAWRMGMKSLLKDAEALAGIPPDYNCINLGRICRLPGSYNNKNGRHTLVEILEFQDAKVDINSIFLRGKELLIKAEEEARAKAEQVSVKIEGKDTFAAIQNLPVANVLCRIRGWETDGHHFWEAGQKKYKACFAPEGKNYIVHGGTDHLPSTKVGFSPFTLVKEALNLDNAKTFAWFKEQYAEIAALSEKKPEEHEKDNESKLGEGATASLESPVMEEPIDIEQFSPMTANGLLDILGITIKRDNQNKLITFLCGLSAYTDDAQFNVSFNAPSSSGKSYIPLEIAQLFPPEDVMELGYTSTQAFFHEQGVYDKERELHVIDLSRKLVIFIDQPHTTLLERMRPLLSHDKRELMCKITDKSKSGGNRTKTIALRGFPSVMFCTASLKLDEQESTRFFLLSPETDDIKLQEAIAITAEKNCDKQTFTEKVASNPQRNLLRQRIRAIRQAKIDDVLIPDFSEIIAVFINSHTNLKPRHQRDVKRLISLVKMFALLNFPFRKYEGKTLIAEQQDIDDAIAIWKSLAEAQEYNLPPYVFDFFKDVISPAYEKKERETHSVASLEMQTGLTHQEIVRAHQSVYHRPIALWKLRQEILPMLDAAGLIEQQPDPNDMRRTLVHPTISLSVSEEEETIES
ncbi:MAG: hypothetical protein PHN33_03790 [Candidatus Peribacteraceae bacterium]|nr:hypothetical protein [Candidatus Peribacteraceae bacterium]